MGAPCHCLGHTPKAVQPPLLRSSQAGVRVRYSAGIGREENTCVLGGSGVLVKARALGIQGQLGRITWKKKEIARERKETLQGRCVVDLAREKRSWRKCVGSYGSGR